MKVRAKIEDAMHNVIASEIIEVSDEPLYGRTHEEIEQIVSTYVHNWSKNYITISFDIIDNNSGSYPYIDWEKRK